MSSNQPSNVEVASRIGVSRTAVSRFRGGSRIPRMVTQVAIAEAYQWPITDQATAHAEGKWAQEFERIIQGH